jgi:hypothetical protein
VGIEEALIDNLVVNTESLTVDTGSLVVNTESLTVDTENLTVDTGVDKKTYVRILSLSIAACVRAGNTTMDLSSKRNPSEP